MPLWQHVMVGTRLLDLWVDDQGAGGPADGRAVNPELLRVARDEERFGRVGDRRPARGRRRTPAQRAHPGPARRRRAARPGGSAAGDRLHLQPRRLRRRRAAVPAGRAAADRAGRARARSARYVEERCADLPDEDLDVLGYHEWLDGLSRGIAAHHAGHAADLQGGRRGAVPARPGQGGVRHRDARARHQHAGAQRGAGEADEVERRDARRGHAGGVHPADRSGRAGAASTSRGTPSCCGSRAWTRARSAASPRPARTRCGPRSGRRTTWRSTSSARSGRHTAREILESSFAQYQADRAVVGLARQVRRNEEALAGYREAMTCHLGDFEEYAGAAPRADRPRGRAVPPRRGPAQGGRGGVAGVAAGR